MCAEKKSYLNSKKKLENELERVNKLLESTCKIDYTTQKFDQYTPNLPEMEDTIKTFKQEIVIIEREIEQLNTEYERENEKHYEETVKSVRKIIFDTALSDKIALPKLLNVGQGMDDYLVESEYKMQYEYYKEEFLSNYLKENLSERGEFETSAHYSERKSDLEICAVQEFDKIALPQMYQYQKTLYSQTFNNNLKRLLALECIRATIGLVELEQYDADKEQFTLNYKIYEQYNDTVLNVPINDAPIFKENFSKNNYKFNVQFFEVRADDQTIYVDAKCNLTIQDKSYAFIVNEKLDKWLTLNTADVYL